MHVTCLRSVLASLAVVFCAAPAVAADPPTGCAMVQVASMPVKYAGPALVPTIAGSVNGREVHMLLDTGADVNAMTNVLADQLKLTQEPTNATVTGVGGETRLYQARIDEMVVGPARSGRAWLQVINDTPNAPFEVIVGAPFLLQADLEIALANRAVKFFRPQNCKDTFLGYWNDPNMIVVPYSDHVRRGQIPHFDVIVNGVKLDAIIDTGAAVSVIELAAARRAGLRLDAPDVKRMSDLVGVGEGKAAHWNAHFAKLALGTEVISDARLCVMESHGGLEVDMLLGRDFLRTHRVLLATSQQKLYISYLGGVPFAGYTNGLPQWIQRELDEGNPDALREVCAVAAASAGQQNVPSQCKARAPTAVPPAG